MNSGTDLLLCFASRRLLLKKEVDSQLSEPLLKFGF